MDRFTQGDRLGQPDGDRLFLRLDERRMGLQLRQDQTLQLQLRPVHRGPVFDPTSLCDFRALRGGDAGRLQAERLPVVGLWLFGLRHDGRNASRSGRKNPDLVQQFVNASAIGWYHYLYGDNTRANEAIKRENPELSDEQIAFSIAKLKEYGIVNSGDALKHGIGAMTDERVKDFFDKLVKVEIVKPDTDYRKAYTLKFVNKGVGLDIRPR